MQVEPSKLCGRCGEVKPHADFYAHPRTKDRLRPICKKCCTETTRERRQRKPEQYKTAQQRQRIARRNADPETFYATKRAKHKAWRDANPDKVATQRLKKLRLYRYGLTEDEYNHILDAQGHACRICGKTRKLQVDHDHRTGAVRGLLCVNCNRGLGYLMDSPRILDRAAQYLRENGGGYGE